MIEARYQPSQPLGPVSRAVGRLVAALLVAGAATALLAVCLSDVGWSRWWLVVAIGAPTIAATSWASRGRGAVRMLFTGVVIAVACALVGSWIWVPEPASFASVRAREAAATATARRVIATMPKNTCRVPTPSDVGVLSELGPWAKVCVYASATGNADGYELMRPSGSAEPDLSYPRAVGECTWHIAGGWYAQAQETSGPGGPCPDGYSFHPGP